MIDFSDKYVLLICEGSVEKDIINLLLENGCLLFSKENLIDKTPTKTRNAKKIAEDFFGVSYEKDVVIVRVIDSPKEAFNIKKHTGRDDEVLTILTRPEIEILIIIAKGDYDEYTKKYKSKQKPSEYCKIKYGMKNIKNAGVVRKFFEGDIDKLVEIIRKHYSFSDKDGYSLYDLMKK